VKTDPDPKEKFARRRFGSRRAIHRCEILNSGAGLAGMRLGLGNAFVALDFPRHARRPGQTRRHCCWLYIAVTID
jgi:hypothetical protein